MPLSSLPSLGSLHKPVWALSLLLLLGSSLAPVSLAVLVNNTVDDTFADPRTGDKILYTPDRAWIEGGANCARCQTRPSQQSLYRGTWHEGTSGGGNGTLVASMAFTGTAIYVYCVLPKTTSNPSGYADLTFTLDNQPAGSFQRTPPGSDGYDYDVLVFSTSSLEDKRHHFFVSSGATNGPASTIILDRIVYSYDDGRSDNSPGKIAGIVVGTLAAVGLVGFAAFFYFFRYRRRRGKPSSQRPVLIDPDNEDDSQPIEYPTVVPFTQSHSREDSSSTPLTHSRAGSASSPLTPTSPTSNSRTSSKSAQRALALQAKPSQASISLSLPYSANQVDIYDPYNRLSVSASGTGTTSDTTAVGATSTLYAAASTSSGDSATVGGDHPPPAYESIPLMIMRDEDGRKKKRGSAEKKRPR